MKSPFSGFKPEAFQFLEALTENQNRIWFAEHRHEYEQYVREPMKGFTVALSDALANKDIPLWGDPKKSLYRINRDARFSKAKHPYNMHASGLFTRTGDKYSSGVLYFRLDPLGCRVAAGYLQPESHVLKKLRLDIMGNPKAWLSIEKALKKKGYELDYSNSLARIPRGLENVPEEVEKAVKLKGWIVRKPLPRSVIYSNTLLKEITGFAADLLPLLSFGWHALEGM
ncbi:TIGR02453 family protein [Polynucleobacter paneuropaeus]|nr:TIGR02453 family protein [Polynucleobacter paneuropaeus]